MVKYTKRRLISKIYIGLFFGLFLDEKAGPDKAGFTNYYM